MDDLFAGLISDKEYLLGLPRCGLGGDKTILFLLGIEAGEACKGVEVTLGTLL